MTPTVLESLQTRGKHRLQQDPRGRQTKYNAYRGPFELKPPTLRFSEGQTKLFVASNGNAERSVLCHNCCGGF